MSTPSATYAANGIAVECGGSGTVMSNTVSDGRYTGGPDWTGATSILLFEVKGVTVWGNAVSNSQTGIGVGSFGWTGPANNNHIVGNTVLDADWGVSLQALAFLGAAPQTNNNKVVNNTISHPGQGTGLTGIEVWAAFITSWEPFAYALHPEWAESNKTIRNTIAGYATAIDDGGSRTKSHANVTPS